MKILLFGTGDYYQRYKKWFVDKDIIGLLDNSSIKQGNMLDGHIIKSPLAAVRYNFDYVYILSVYDQSMRSQLLSLGISEDKIRNVFDIHTDFGHGIEKKPIKFYFYDETDSIYQKKKKPLIALLFHDFHINGASIALLYGAKVLKEQGYNVIAVAEEDGSLKKQLLDWCIPVIIDVNLQVETMKNSRWIQNCTLIFCNTMNFYQFLSSRNIEIPVIWWLHDPSFFYEMIHEDLLKKIDQRNLFLYSVGKLPADAYRKYFPKAKFETLLYGVMDRNVNYNNKVQTNKMIFMVVGYVREWKGQDVFVNAAKRFDKNFPGKAEFLIVGDDSSLFAQKLKESVADISSVYMLGEKNTVEVQKLYSKMTVLVCPSRQETMSMTVTEAMMYGKPCIVSSSAGISEYIRDGEDGMVFPSEDDKALFDKMCFCMQHRGELDVMGKKARKIYERNFSMKVFSISLREIIGRWVK